MKCPDRRGLAPLDDLAAALEQQELDVVAVVTQLVAVVALQRRARDHAAVGMVDQPPADQLEPRPAVAVVERLAARHLLDVGGGVQVVGVLEGDAQPTGEGGADGGLARAGHAHDDDRMVEWHGREVPVRASRRCSRR